jgi:hypothetical protein
MSYLEAPRRSNKSIILEAPRRSVQVQIDGNWELIT